MEKWIWILVFLSTFLTSALAQEQEEQPFSQEEYQQTQVTIQEIVRLTRPSEMPRRIGLLNLVLTRITKNNRPQLWAWLQMELANSLCRNPLDARAENIERAIEHYGLALQMYTREAFPQDWATIQNNLATAYRNRIRGGALGNF